MLAENRLSSECCRHVNGRRPGESNLPDGALVPGRTAVYGKVIFQLLIVPVS
jgi:hypothetical protein